MADYLGLKAFNSGWKVRFNEIRKDPVSEQSRTELMRKIVAVRDVLLQSSFALRGIPID